MNIHAVERVAGAPQPARADRSSPAPPPPAERKRIWNWLRAGLGFVVLGGLIYQLGDTEMLKQIGALGWWLPVVMVPYGLFSVLDVLGWRCVIPAGTVVPSVRRLYAIRLAGEAVNDFTPTASVGGEPLKAYMLRDAGVRMTSAVASVVLARTAVTAGQVLFIVLGFAVLVVHSHREIAWIVGLAVLIAASTVFIGAMVHWQRRGLLAGVVHWTQRFVGTRVVGPMWAARGRAVDREVATLYESRRGDFALSVFLHFASWALGVVELMVFVWLVGSEASWVDLTIVEALNQPVKAVGILIPGGIGVQEAGGVAAFALLGLDPRVGLTVMLLRRAREVFFGVVGLALLRWLPRPAMTAAAGS